MTSNPVFEKALALTDALSRQEITYEEWRRKMSDILGHELPDKNTIELEWARRIGQIH